MITMDFGGVLAASASREVITRTPSTGRPGIRRILQPVASRMFFVLKNFPLCSPSVISTMPGTVTWPRPTK